MSLSLSVRSSDVFGTKPNPLLRIWDGSFRAEPWSLETIATLVSDKLIDGIEFIVPVHMTAEALKKVYRLTSDYHIPVFSIHQPLRQLIRMRMPLASIETLFKQAQAFCARVIVIHLFPVGKRILDHAYSTQIKTWEKQYGIAVAFENSTKNIGTRLFRRYSWHGGSFARIMEQSGFHVTFDTTHLGQSGGDILAFFDTNKNRIANIHLSDCGGSLRKTHLPLGKGTLPMQAFLQRLKTNRYDGLLTLEIDARHQEVLESIKMIKTGG